MVGVLYFRVGVYFVMSNQLNLCSHFWNFILHGVSVATLDTDLDLGVKTGLDLCANSLISPLNCIESSWTKLVIIGYKHDEPSVLFLYYHFFLFGHDRNLKIIICIFHIVKSGILRLFIKKEGCMKFSLCAQFMSPPKLFI